jgi:hypothetical protein
VAGWRTASLSASRVSNLTRKKVPRVPLQMSGKNINKWLCTKKIPFQMFVFVLGGRFLDVKVIVRIRTLECIVVTIDEHCSSSNSSSFCKRDPKKK